MSTAYDMSMAGITQVAEGNFHLQKIEFCVTVCVGRVDDFDSGGGTKNTVTTVTDRHGFLDRKGLDRI